MRRPTPEFQPSPGTVYRTRDLLACGQSHARTARLVQEGRLRQLQRGLYYAPRRSSFGPVPASEGELLRAYFGDPPYLRTGPSVWNALGLGSSSVEVVPLVYNTTKTGQLELGNRRFELRRASFPQPASAEFFVVDLLDNTSRAGVERAMLLRNLAAAFRAGRFDPLRLREMASMYGTRETQALLEGLVRPAVCSD